MMNPDLQAAIDDLYQVFASYRLNPDMGYCDHCVSDDEARVLVEVPLRLLTADQLERLTSKATSTWGDVHDLKHFLPRIMELLARRELDWWWTLGKALRQAVSYTQGQPDEHVAVQRFRMQLWRAFLTSAETPASAVEVMEALQEYDQPLMPFLIARSEMDTCEAANHQHCPGPQ